MQQQDGSHNFPISNRIIHTTQPIKTNDFGCNLWKSGLFLSRYLDSVFLPALKRTGMIVLEIGAGVGLPSLLCTSCASIEMVYATDASENALENLRHEICLNVGVCDAAKIKVCQFQWGDLDQHKLFFEKIDAKRGFDLILAADLFYNTKDFGDIVASIAWALSVSAKECICLMVYEERSSRRSIRYLLDRWRLVAEQIDFGDSDELFMFKITRNLDVSV